MTFETVTEDSLDNITKCQLLALSLCSLYSILLQNFLNKNYFVDQYNHKKNKKNDENKILFLSILQDYYEVFQSIFKVLSVRIRHTKWIQNSEFCFSLSCLVQTISAIENSSEISVFLQSRIKNCLNIQRLKKNISQISLNIARQIRDAGKLIPS